MLRIYLHFYSAVTSSGGGGCGVPRARQRAGRGHEVQKAGLDQRTRGHTPTPRELRCGDAAVPEVLDKRGRRLLSKNDPAALLTWIHSLATVHANMGNHALALPLIKEVSAAGARQGASIRKHCRRMESTA